MQRRRPQNENRSGELGVHGRNSWDNTQSRMHQSGRLAAVRDEAPVGLERLGSDTSRTSTGIQRGVSSGKAETARTKKHEGYQNIDLRKEDTQG